MMRDNIFAENFCAINSSSILEAGQPWSQFILLSDNHPVRNQVKHAVLSHPSILQITKKLRQLVLDPESAPLRLANFRIYGSYYWLLRFLADIGISAQDYGIHAFIEQLKFLQLEDGQFLTYYHQKKQQAITFVCITAHLLYCLSRLGLKSTRMVSAGLNYLATTQRFDGGWHCDDMRQNGERDQFLPSCPSATIHSMLALGQLGESCCHIVNKAIRFIQTFSENDSNSFCRHHSESLANLNKLRYPPHYSGFDVLNVIYTFSFLPDLMQHSRLEHLINQVLKQWDGSHWLGSAKKIPEWKNFDFGCNSNGSDWITSLFLSSLRRLKFYSP